MPPAILETARLHLRPQATADLDSFMAMDMDPAVHRYIWPDGAPDPEVHREKVRQDVASGWPETGGFWVAEWLREPGFLGWCGLFPLEDSGLIEIGYRFVTAAWGQGVATEAARAVLDHGFGVLEIDPIVAVTHPENRASRWVLEKLGLSSEGAQVHYGQDVAFYRLTRVAYLSAAPRASVL